YVECRRSERSLGSALGPLSRRATVTAALGSAEPLLRDERLEHELARSRGVARRTVFAETDFTHGVEQAGHRAEPLDSRFRRRRLPELEHAAAVEVLDDLDERRLRRLAAPRLERLVCGFRNQLACDLLRTDEFALV